MKLVKKLTTCFFCCLFISLSSFAQDLPPKQAYPLEVRQIHSGHSLTDPLFGQPWPGQYVELITFLRGQWAGDDIGKSTIPGSPMHWRWNNSSGYPDARHNINEFELLSITEVANMCYEGGSDQQWYLECIQDHRTWLSTWVNHAWNNGNNGQGAATLLWTNWVNIDDSDGPFRQMLDNLNGQWESMQDYANANRPNGATHVYMIPGNRMMARLYDDVQAGIVPGITNFSDFFEDNIHVNSLGAYAVAMIHYACIFNESPVGLPNQLINNPPAETPIPSVALATYIQNMVWDIVTNYPRTGIYLGGGGNVVASFTANPTSGVAPLNVNFDASASQNNGTGSLTYVWNFGDGSTGNGQMVSHVYQNPGTYTVSLTVSNSSGASDTATRTITVQSANQPPVAIISATPTNGNAPLTVQFNGNGSIDNAGGGLNYAWSFGDGSTGGNQSTVSHTYNNPGSYVAVLTVTDANAMIHSATVAITVNDPDQEVDCELFAYEGFDYAIGQPLHHQNGGFGWSESWIVQNEVTSSNGYSISSNSLEYRDLTVNGGHVRGGIDFVESGRAINTSPDGPFANYVSNSNPFIGGNPQGQDLWMSVLMRKNKNSGDELSATLHSSDVPWCTLCTDVDRIAVGYFGEGSDVSGQQRWSLMINGEIFPTSVPLVMGETALLVVQIRFNQGNTLVNLYVNPTNLGAAPPSSPTISRNTNRNNAIRSFAFYGGLDQDASIDEVRLGESYACVTPVPQNGNPVAAIIANPTQGTAPLTVNFSGSGSTDNSGQGLSYQWDFGVGGASASGMTAAYTYNSPGSYTARLTVTDGNGLSNSTTISINVQNVTGDYRPCLTTITSMSMANCNGSGGHIRVNRESGVNYTLHFNGANIPLTSDHEYRNLSAGEYVLRTNGPGGCSEEFRLQVRVDSTTCPGWTSAECSMLMGTNMNGFADWEPHRAMKNLLKNTRGEPIPYTDNCNCWSFDNWEEVLSQMNFDENGYPIGIPQSTSEGQTKLRFFSSADGHNTTPDQSYVLLYDGAGEISLHGAISDVQRSSGRIQFNLGGDGTFWFQIESSQAANYIRNIRLLRIEHEHSDLEADPFYEGFIEKIQPFQLLRFMDWMAINNSPVVNWSDRKLPEYYTYGGANGVPYEVIIQLANQTKQDVWICVPHAATDDFIYRMAELFRDNLDPELTIFLEYSNEVWNWIFEQAFYNEDNNPNNLMYGRAYAEKARNTFAIWHEVFGEEACKVKRVLGIQGGFNYLNEHIMAHIPQDEWDFGSPTHYFGLDHGDTGVPRLDLLGSNATVEDIMQNAENSFRRFSMYLKEDFRNTQLLGKEVITYEGGQHFVGNVFGIPYDYQQAMWDAQNSEAMYQAYQMMFDSISTWGCKLATNFSLVGPQENIFGSWGMMDDIDIEGPYRTTAPKYQVHLDNMPSKSCAQALRDQWFNCESGTVNVEDLDQATVPSVKVYPNPGMDYIQVLSGQEDALIEFYDVFGKLVLSTRERLVNTSILPNGVYFISCENQTVKWVKMQ
jgi:PKD repeat protein